MFDEELLKEAEAILARCRTENIKIVTAESCTGGLLAGLFTEVAGASDVFERGFVTYSNQSKIDLLNVPLDILASYGAVSPQVALAMAEGAIANSYANLAVAVTGVAGPSGGTADKPVGLVYIAAKRHGRETKVVEQRFGKKKRSVIRHMTVKCALSLL